MENIVYKQNRILIIKQLKSLMLLLPFVLILTNCSGNGDLADAYGNFEATEIVVSSEANGKVISSNLENGMVLKAGELVAQVDTVTLYLKYRQLLAAKNEITVNTRDVLSQIDVLNEQKNSLIIEQKRIENLIADSAATGKQYDDVMGRIKVIDRQVDGVRAKNMAVLSKLDAINVQIEEIHYELSKCKIINPIDGTVLQKYIEPYELVIKGKSLYKIANMEQLELKAYVDGMQLGQIKIGQKVKVYIDKSKDENKELEGVISWISANAEFTPKIIQTKEERVKLVYAIKVLVKNDGSVKIGMPGEVRFKIEKQ
jgi:HlyD family secretion protein